MRTESKPSAGPPSEARATRVSQPKKTKLPVFLLSTDDSLWPQVGVYLSSDMSPVQVDSVNDLTSTTKAGQSAIVLWDARGEADRTAVLSGLQLHSPRFAIIALDGVTVAGAWDLPIRQNQIVAVAMVPLSGAQFTKAMETAREEVATRIALLGDATAPLPAGSEKKRHPPWLAIAAGACIVVIAAVGLSIMYSNRGPKIAAPLNIQPPVLQTAKKPSGSTDEKIDVLLEQARRAMSDRHFMEPAEGSALVIYRDVLNYDSTNGEARQGLLRLAEILYSRVQSALDERRFDVALQALETARSIAPNDERLAALDGKIENQRSELGPAQIQAALNAQNYDRAASLIEDAVRAKSLSSAKAAQLRDEIRRRRQDSELSRVVKLIDTRLLQDRLIDPREDSAAHYIDQARQAGAAISSLQAQIQELSRRLLGAARSAVEQHRSSDADRYLAAARTYGATAAATANLVRDIAAARTQGGREKTSDLARESLDGGQKDSVQSLSQQANETGPSSDINALNERPKQLQPTERVTLAEVRAESLSALVPLKPKYPDAALRHNIEGWVEVALTVTAEGKVAGLSVIKSLPVGTFDAAAVEAVSRMRYQPVIQNGQATAVTTKFRVTFRLFAH